MPHPRAARPFAPVQHGAAREVPAAADERQPGTEIARLALPQLDERVGPRDPALVVGVHEHRALEARRPIGWPHGKRAPLFELRQRIELVREFLRPRPNLGLMIE